MSALFRLGECNEVLRNEVLRNEVLRSEVLRNEVLRNEVASPMKLCFAQMKLRPKVANVKLF